MTTVLRNHLGCQGCNGRRPLTLADREQMHGRPFRQWEDGGLTCYCTRCLADLPHGLEALAHVCEDELPPVHVGDVVRYHGSLTEYRGYVFEVTVVHGNGRLRLFSFPDLAIDRVHRASVTLSAAEEVGSC